MNMETTSVLLGVVLVALALIFVMLSRIFSRLNGAQNPVQEAGPSVAAVSAKPVSAVVSGVAPEIVAAITAAVFSIDGAGAVVSSVRPLQSARTSTRGAWGFAGRQENTLPF